MEALVRRLVTVTMLSATVMLMSPSVSGQNSSGTVHRSSGNGTVSRSEQATRPSEGRRPGNDNSGSNWNSKNNNGSNNKNNGSSWSSNNRRPNSGVRPSTTTRPNVRPSSPARPAVRPSTPGRVIRTSRNVYPAWTRYGRPSLPSSYRPNPRYPIISSVLGVSFGTYLNSSISYWRNAGYAYEVYEGEAILSNVRELGYRWPVAYVNYDNYGRMTDVQFQYIANGFSKNRFYTLRRTLDTRYGVPVAINNDARGSQYTWYGGDGRGFVTLEFYWDYNQSFTTLSYGY